MITLVEAIERKNWELVALLLMLGLSRVLAQLPQGSADDLLAVLEADDDES
jgi:hypothetical protein